MKKVSLLPFLLPALFLFLLFYAYPAIQTFAGAFFKWDLLSHERQFVWFSNFVSLVHSDRFLHAFKNTILWAVCFPALSLAFGFFISLFFYFYKPPFFLRILFLLPMAISLTAGGILWTLVYNPDFGFVNTVLDALSLSFLKKGWLSDPGVVNYSLIVSGVWLWCGFVVLILSAGLAGISREIIEAARLDGASGITLVYRVIFPLLRNPFVVAAGTSLMTALKMFDLVFTMTRGGPGHSSEVAALLLWRQAFEFGQAGEAAATAVILSSVIFLCSIPYLRRVVAE